jgi:hypothetical protein
MVSMSRSAALEVESSGGQNVWWILCRAALRGADWAAAACGVKDTANGLERAELLIGYGVTPEPPDDPRQQTVDWAKLDNFERGRLSREMRRAERARQRLSDTAFVNFDKNA